MNPFHSPWRAALSGASVAFAAALVYAVLFSIAASVRGALQILQVYRGSPEVGLTILANTTSIFIVSVEFAIVLGLLGAVIQGIIWGLIAWAPAPLQLGTLSLSRPLLACLLALLVSAGLHALLWSSSGVLHSMVWLSFSNYLFWLGLPCLIFTALTTWAWRTSELGQAAGMERLAGFAGRT